MNICRAYYAYCAYYAPLMNDSKITWLPIAASFCSFSKSNGNVQVSPELYSKSRGTFSQVQNKKITKEQCSFTGCPFGCKCLLIAFLAPPPRIHYHLLAHSITKVIATQYTNLMNEEFNICNIRKVSHRKQISTLNKVFANSQIC